MNAPFPHPDPSAADQPSLRAEASRDVCVATVALIVPVHNEEAAIAPFLEAVYRNTEVLTEQGIAFDFIFVNDGSTDATLDCLLLAQKDDPRIRQFGQSQRIAEIQFVHGPQRLALLVAYRPAAGPGARRLRGSGRVLHDKAHVYGGSLAPNS